MTGPARGALVKAFPRTFTIKNWPFLVLLLLLGGVPAGVNLALGDWKIGLLILAGTASVPALFGGMQAAMEASGHYYLDALHERGFVIRRLFSKTWVPWSEVWGITSKHQKLPSDVVIRVLVVEVASVKKPVRLELDQAEAATFIAEETGLPIREG